MQRGSIVHFPWSTQDSFLIVTALNKMAGNKDGAGTIMWMMKPFEDLFMSFLHASLAVFYFNAKVFSAACLLVMLLTKITPTSSWFGPLFPHPARVLIQINPQASAFDFSCLTSYQDLCLKFYKSYIKCRKASNKAISYVKGLVKSKKISTCLPLVSKFLSIQNV